MFKEQESGRKSLRASDRRRVDQDGHLEGKAVLGAG
jgi:hypothetical protein